MGEIKRVLWIDDNPGNKSSDAFSSVETTIVSSMEEAIDIFSGDHLYDYDTIVLDIDFGDDLTTPKVEKHVIELLTQKIYLEDDQKNKKYIVFNGGYLLYIYLLEKGYPSDRIAFLTGNAAMIEQLQIFSDSDNGSAEHSVYDLFLNAWNECNNDAECFIEKINKLNIHSLYKDEMFVINCFKGFSGMSDVDVEKMINDIHVPQENRNIPNTGDMMIFRFHKANIKTPVYFSKHENDLPGHNFEDAQKWLLTRRTSDNLTRWFVLDMADYIERKYLDDENAMKTQVGGLFDNHSDPGLRTAFGQMYLVFDGLKNNPSRGVYYQALSAMLIPFGEKLDIEIGKDDVYSICNYDEIRKMFAWFSRKARNYCAHNYFESLFSYNGSAIYLLMGSSLAVMSDEQRKDIDIWYETIEKTEALFGNSSYSVDDNIDKINRIFSNLLTGDKFDAVSAKVNKAKNDPNSPRITDVSRYRNREILDLFGWNKPMRLTVTDTELKEQYYIFTLAAYVVKWFDHMPEEEVGSRYGKGVEIMYRISNRIVSDYEYREAR